VRMSAVVAYIVLKKKREGRPQEPKKKKVRVRGAACRACGRGGAACDQDAHLALWPSPQCV